MKHRKILFLSIFVHMIFVSAFAQSTENDNTTDVLNAPQNTGRMLLREILVDTFDDPTGWQVQMPIDKGIAYAKRIFGGSKKKTPIRVAEQINNYSPSDNYVYGVRVEYFSRNTTQIAIQAIRPKYVTGIVKKISVWVSGRGKGHELSIILRDMQGNIKKLPLGILNFTGWKKLETSIPIDVYQVDINDAGYGLYIIGFVIDTKFEDTVGRYYIYFDNVRAITDVLEEAIKEEDDITDGW